MILIDANQMIINVITSDLTNIHEADVRYKVINFMRYNKKKFKKYGDIVLAFDSKVSWRKKFYPYYKESRKKHREESSVDWDEIYRILNTLKGEFKQHLPYKLIDIDECEGDDIIAVLTKWSQTNDLDDTIVSSPKPLMIISSDEDFLQLQKYSNVSQMSLSKKKLITVEGSVRDWLEEKIFRGESGKTKDGIPNVLSGDNYLVDGIRQHSVTTKKVAEWLVSHPDDESFKKNYNRNKTLIDFECIPEDIQKRIINTFESYETNKRDKLMNYFIKNRMSNLMEFIQDF